MSRTLFSTSVKSPKSLARASAASTEFWAACSKRTKNSLFLGRSDRRTGVLLWRHILRHRDRRREVPSDRRLADALGQSRELRDLLAGCLANRSSRGAPSIAPSFW